MENEEKGHYNSTDLYRSCRLVRENVYTRGFRVVHSDTDRPILPFPYHKLVPYK